MSDVDLRREARRRRILENAENRLKRIGVVEGKSVNSTTIPTYNFEEHEDNHTYATHNGVLPQMSTPIFPEEKLEKQPQTKNTRIIGVVLIAFVYVLFGLCGRMLGMNLDELYLNKLFLPLLCFELVYHSTHNDAHIANNKFMPLLVLLNVHSTPFGVYLKWFSLFGIILQDVMIYLFVIAFGCLCTELYPS